MYHVLIFSYCLLTSGYAQQIDTDFSRNGLLLFKELGMVSSHIVDFEVIEENKINVLYESDAKRNLVRLHKNGKRDIKFDITSSNLNNQNSIPVGLSTKSGGSVLVLSNFWNGHSWMISINGFYEDGSVNHGFGRHGVYKKNILNNLDDNYGQYIYASSSNEIIVVAKVQGFNTSNKKEKIAILKLSDIGETLSSSLYDDHHFTLNCSAMEDDYLLLGYSESVDNGQEQSTYLAGFDSDQMASNNLYCLTIEEDYQSFDHIVLSNSELFTSQIENASEGVYRIRKYGAKGNLDTSFFDSGEMGFDADIYNTDFVVNKEGEVFIISTSLDSELEILIKKLLSNGDIDTDYGVNGIASVFLKYPISNLNKIRLGAKNELYISGSMGVEGDSYGFITKLKLNVQQLKKEKLEKFLDNLFTKE
ncbi:hypothetical protein [Aquimarina sp. 2201CG14-23]|uniref:hypothetical protein n=1 Tax=Aquimarina mycalae TaxID=3040073 RepID=UPI002477F33C|nr:hypothetical protein [Aquimarina sp. 2201CG14-23]MDH7444553.1 hypothetical protein [Aquimarina sp. 2201CG14-23]